MKSWKQLVYEPLRYLRYVSTKAKRYFYQDQKSSFGIVSDLIRLHIRSGEFCDLYYALGLNVKGRHISDFVSKKELIRYKGKAEKVIKGKLGLNLDYDAIAKDKFYANSILTANGISCTKDIAVIINGKVHLPDGNRKDVFQLAELGSDLVLKNVALEASEGICFFRSDNEPISESLLNRISKGIWVIQQRYRSHEAIRRINSSALNILRLVTVFDGETHQCIGGFQSFATGSAETDSWDKGSIFVGLDVSTGRLSHYGFRNPWHKDEGLITHHPDSGISFEDFEIPYFEEAVSMCIKGHNILYPFFFLGWDVAITDSGPRVVEVNEKPGMNVIQCVDISAGKKIRELYQKCIKSNK